MSHKKTECLQTYHSLIKFDLKKEDKYEISECLNLMINIEWMAEKPVSCVLKSTPSKSLMNGIP